MKNYIDKDADLKYICRCYIVIELKACQFQPAFGISEYHCLR